VKKFFKLFQSPAVRLSWSFQVVNGSADFSATKYAGNPSRNLCKDDLLRSRLPYFWKWTSSRIQTQSIQQKYLLYTF